MERLRHAIRVTFSTSAIFFRSKFVHVCKFTEMCLFQKQLSTSTFGNLLSNYSWASMRAQSSTHARGHPGYAPPSRRDSDAGMLEVAASTCLITTGRGEFALGLGQSSRSDSLSSMTRRGLRSCSVYCGSPACMHATSCVVTCRRISCMT